MTREEILKWLIDNNCIDTPVVRWAMIAGVQGAAEVDRYIERERADG